MGSCAARYDDTHRGFVEHAQKSAVVFVVMFAILVISGFSMIWPAIVMTVVGVKLGAHARRAYGGHGADPAELEAAEEPDFTSV